MSLNETEIVRLKKSTSVEPLKKGGSSFKTHKLVETIKGVLEFKPTIGLIIFSSIFILAGLGVFLFFLYNFYNNGFYLYDGSIVAGLVGLFFLAISYFLFRHQFKANQFNKHTNRYRKGNKTSVIKKNDIDIPLSKIIALQLIGEHIKGSKSSYNSFELNLVLDDGTRFNVVDHSNLKSLIKDTRMLSEFLNVPIWHAESSKDES